MTGILHSSHLPRHPIYSLCLLRHHAGHRAFLRGLQPRLHFGEVGKDPSTPGFPKACIEFLSSCLLLLCIKMGLENGALNRFPGTHQHLDLVKFTSSSPSVKWSNFCYTIGQEKSALLSIYAEALKFLAFDTQIIFPSPKTQLLNCKFF